MKVSGSNQECPGHEHSDSGKVPQAAGRGGDQSRQDAFALLESSLRSKHATGFRVGSITEDDQYGDDPV
jgi:hypothetical protein